MYDENNIFAKIIRGELPCEKTYEDQDVLFFKDINPIAKIHILGLPKVPCVDFSDFISNYNENTIAHFFKKIEMVICNLELKNQGYRIVSNSGEGGGQEVPHFHIHILGGGKIGTKK